MGDDGWPPRGDPERPSTDERQLAVYVESAGLDQAGNAAPCA
jgi:hypothetical protein